MIDGVIPSKINMNKLWPPLQDLKWLPNHMSTALLNSKHTCKLATTSMNDTDHGGTLRNQCRPAVTKEEASKSFLITRYPSIPY
jgi:hypothetical protein